MNHSSSDALKCKLGLLKLAEHLGNVSRACEIMGYSRDSYYRFKKLYDNGGVEALRGTTKPQRVPKNRTRPDVEQACLEIALHWPSWSRVQVCRELSRRGVEISAATVRRIWLRHGLETKSKRLRVLLTPQRLASASESSVLI